MTASSHPLVVALTNTLQDASEVLEMSADSISVLNVEVREWQDSCLGVPAEGEVCADVVSPGYRITLAEGLVYHADQTGNVRIARRQDPATDTEIRLRYSVSGGIGGRRSDFETDSYRLTDAEEAELRQLITDAKFFDAQNLGSMPTVHDGYVYRLWIAVGRRQHEIVRGDGIEIDDSEAMESLMRWASDRAPALFPHLNVALD